MYEDTMYRRDASIDIAAMKAKVVDTTGAGDAYWGPRLPDAGVWRPVEVLALRKARLESVLF